METDVVGLPISPMMAVTPDLRFAFALLKNAVADCPSRLAEIARR